MNDMNVNIKDPSSTSVSSFIPQFKDSKAPSKQLQLVEGLQNDSPNRFEPGIEETRRFMALHQCQAFSRVLDNMQIFPQHAAIHLKKIEMM